MMCGIPPFYTHNKNQNIWRILNEEISFPPDVELSFKAKGLLTGVYSILTIVTKKEAFRKVGV